MLRDHHGDEPRRARKSNIKRLIAARGHWNGRPIAEIGAGFRQRPRPGVSKATLTGVNEPFVQFETGLNRTYEEWGMGLTFKAGEGTPAPSTLPAADPA